MFKLALLFFLPLLGEEEATSFETGYSNYCSILYADINKQVLSHVICSSSLEKAVQLVNRLDSAKFPLLLNRIAQTLQTDSTEKPFTPEEEEKLQASLGLDKDDLSLLLESITFIFEQVRY